VLSTDDPAIAEVGRGHGLEVPFLRPAALASDTAGSFEVVEHAVDWLERDECQQIFTEFHDQAGRPLTVRLAELHVTAADFLRLIVWRDGTYTSQCQRGPLAFTTPGSRLVFVCSRQFADLTFGDWELARAVVIHEALHSLGLGENPPSSREITARVRARCGRATDKGRR